MKAPKKLYLRKRNKLPLEVVRNMWYETDPQSIYGSVEYIRKDAFIEKAEEYLQEHLIDYYSHIIDKKGFIENFRKYVKGE